MSRCCGLAAIATKPKRVCWVTVIGCPVCATDLEQDLPHHRTLREQHEATTSDCRAPTEQIHTLDALGACKAFTPLSRAVLALAILHDAAITAWPSFVDCTSSEQTIFPHSNKQLCKNARGIFLNQEHLYKYITCVCSIQSTRADNSTPSAEWGAWAVRGRPFSMNLFNKLLISRDLDTQNLHRLSIHDSDCSMSMSNN